MQTVGLGVCWLPPHLSRQQAQRVQRLDGVALAGQQPRHLAPHPRVGGVLHGAEGDAAVRLLQQHLDRCAGGGGGGRKLGRACGHTGGLLLLAPQRHTREPSMPPGQGALPHAPGRELRTCTIIR
jgi:hypothetical protein